ncbi:NADH-dependent oxidoreductase, partial [mine drainage metagenome]
AQKDRIFYPEIYKSLNTYFLLILIKGILLENVLFMEKILLIGGYGFLGSNVYTALSNEYSVEVMSRFKHGGTNIQGKDWIEGNITSKADMEIVMGRGYDYVFDFVGLINEKEQKHYDVSVTGMQNIIDAIN